MAEDNVGDTKPNDGEVSRIKSWADESDDEDLEDDDEPEVDEEGNNEDGDEEDWSGPHVSGTTVEELELALSQHYRDMESSDEESESEEEAEDIKLVAPVLAKKPEPPAQPLSKKEQKRLADLEFERQLAEAMGTVPDSEKAGADTATKEKKEEPKQEEKEQSESSSSNNKKKKKKKNKKKAAEPAPEAKPEVAPAKELTEDEIQAARQALAAKKEAARQKAMEKKKIENAKRKEAEKKRKAAIKAKQVHEQKKLGLPRFSTDNSIGGDGRGG
eukprot:m.335022 g.335022  ORF g.335022 m.335022 type:complete len:273 (+) comp17493_c0_seq1:223-1041(+)